MRVALGALLLSMSPVSGAIAQSDGPMAALDLTRLRGGTDRYRVTFSQDSTERDWGWWTINTSFREVDGEPMALKISRFPAPDGAMLDSSLYSRRTLRTIWQHTHMPRRTVIVAFDGRRVVGYVRVADSAPQPIDKVMPDSAYDLTVMAEILGALPLAEGFHTVLPFFAWNQAGQENDTITVVGREAIMTDRDNVRQAWIVRFADPQSISTLWIDVATRKRLRYVVTPRAGGTRLSMVRIEITRP